MRKLFTLALIFLCLNVSFANVPVIIPALKASEIFLPIGKTGQKISLLELSRVTIKDFELLSGQKMKFFARLNFKVAQKKLKNNINDDGTLNNKKLFNAFAKAQKEGGPVLAAVEGFALGLLSIFFGIGVLIAYLIKDKYKKQRVKWAWIGFAAMVLLIIILLISGVGFGFPA